jgi:predicted PhzF superfamily epimerase YddE/YHI9
LAPDFRKVAALEGLGLIATAPGEPGSGVDFVSRFFAPKHAVDEDPVTGSAHCELIPYWAQRLGKKTLFARQVSQRGGEIWCEDKGARVRIAGQCARFMTGVIEI